MKARCERNYFGTSFSLQRLLKIDDFVSKVVGVDPNSSVSCLKFET